MMMQLTPFVVCILGIVLLACTIDDKTCNAQLIAVAHIHMLVQAMLFVFCAIVMTCLRSYFCFLPAMWIFVLLSSGVLAGVLLNYSILHRGCAQPLVYTSYTSAALDIIACMVAIYELYYAPYKRTIVYTPV